MPNIRLYMYHTHRAKAIHFSNLIYLQKYSHKFQPNYPKMNAFWILIFVPFIATNSLDKADSVKLELKTFDEIFGDGWWEKGEAKDFKMPAPTNFGQNVHHQIDRQNTQIGQIETNSTDQNLPLTESSHPDIAKNGEELIAEDERKRKIIDKFHAIKDEFKQKGKYSKKEWVQIGQKIAKHLKVNRSKIYKWKKELGISGKPNGKEERKNLVKKFDQMKAELKRDGFKNSYKNELDKTVAKKLELGVTTIYKWKRKLGQTKSNKYAHNEQKELIKRYYEIKEKNPKIIDEDIAKKFLKIGTNTLFRWKKQFKRQQFRPNSVDGQSLEENATANVQKFENSNSGST